MLLAAATVAYFLAARIGFLFAEQNPSVSPIWPAAGVGLAILLLLRPGAWPAVFVGAYAANAFVTGPGPVSIAMAAGSTLAALAGAWLLRAFNEGLRSFHSVKHVFRFLLVGATAATVAASVTAATLVLAGLQPIARAPSCWATGWLGGLTGALVVTPVLVLLLGRPLHPWRPIQRSSDLGPAAAIFLAICATAYLVFAPRSMIDAPATPAAFVFLPLVVWSAFRFHQPGAAAATAFIGAVAAAGTWTGAGPFHAVGGSSLFLATFLSVLAILGLVVGAIVHGGQEAFMALGDLKRELEDRVHARTAELEAADARFKSFMGHLPGSATIKDASGRYVFVNPAFAATFGKTPSDLEGATAHDVFPESIAGRIAEADRDVLRRQKPTLAEEHWTVRGEPRYSLVSRFPIPGADGRAAYTGAVAIDITEQRRVRDNLRRIEERFRLLVEGTRDYAMILLDPDGHVTSWNPGAERINGYSEAEIIGRDYATFFTPEDVAKGRPQEILDRAASTGHVEVEGVRVRKDGTRLFVNAVVTALREPDGRLRGFAKVTRDITERRKAEDELRARAEELAEAQRIAHVGSWELDMKGMRLRGSPEMFRLFGLPDDVEFQPFDKIIALLPPDQMDLARDVVGRTIETQEPFSIDVRVHPQGRDEAWLHIEGRIVHDGTSRVAGTAQDITDRKRLEARLEASADRFRALAENAKDAIISAGFSGQIGFVNRAARDLFGYTEDELKGKSLTVLMPERFHKDHLAGFRRFLETGVARIIGNTTELVGRRKDGTEFPLEMSLATWTQDGQPRFIGIMRDITERRRADARLQESLEQFQVLAEGLPVGVFHTGPTGTIDYANRRWMEITGANYEGAHAAATAIHPEDLSALQTAWKRTVERGTELVTSFRVVQPDGTVRTCAAHASPVRDSLTGRIVGFVGFLEDVTEANRLREMERRGQQTEIEHLRELNAFRSRFINTAAHELRTPLVPLRSQLELLKVQRAQNVLAGAEGDHALDVMERNLERLSLLVEDLLESARYQAGRLGIAAAPGDLHRVVREAVESFLPAARERALRLDVETYGDGSCVFDPRRISQVLYNVLSNALKFTRPGGRIHVVSRGLRDRLQIVIEDTGVGIEAADLPRLFQPFSQVHDTREVTQPGSGLGLYISKALVEMHGGTIEAESPGANLGSIFTIVLPRELLRQGLAASDAPTTGALRDSAPMDWRSDPTLA